MRAVRPVIMLFTSVLIGAGTVGCQQRQSELKVHPHVLDVEYNDGKSIVKKVVLENIGGRALKIVNISPSCSCVVPTLKKWSLETGERAEVVFTITSPDFGDKDVDVGIDTDSSKTPVDVVELHLKGPPISVPRIWKHPPVTMIPFSDLEVAKMTQIEVITLEAAKSDAWISGINVPAVAVAHVSCKLAHIEDESAFGKEIVARKYSFDLAVQPHKFERFNLKLNLVSGTSDGQSVEGNYTVVCDPAPVIQKLPASLRFFRDGAATSEKVLVLKSDADEPFDVNLTTNLPFCSVSLVDEQDGTKKPTVILRVSVDWRMVPESKSGDFQLVLHTSHPGCDKVEVPLSLERSDENTK